MGPKRERERMKRDFLVSITGLLLLSGAGEVDHILKALEREAKGNHNLRTVRAQPLLPSLLRTKPPGQRATGKRFIFCDIAAGETGFAWFCQRYSTRSTGVWAAPP